MTDDDFNAAYEGYATVFRQSIAWDLLMWATVYPEAGDAIRRCANHIAAGERASHTKGD